MLRPSACSLLAALLLTACQAAPPPPAEPAPAAAPQAVDPPKNEESTELRDAIQEPIDKAKATEADTLKAAEDQRQQIEDAGG